MKGWGVFLIILLLIIIIAAGGWIGYTQLRARRLGLPPPSLNPFARSQHEAPSNYRAPAPAPGGIQGWVTDKWNTLRNKRTAGGAYESTNYGGARGVGSQRRGFGPLDPDEAWDARVDHETSGYYEEQELGLQDPAQGPYGGSGYGHIGVAGIEEGRGRSRSRQRELDARYEAETQGRIPRSDPFGDGAEPSNLSLRAISPRPDASARPGSAHNNQPHSGDSPTERRSMFHEEM
ncbi:Hypothetical protein R9X50_00563000 [Acrodontium crateriforme]|uniref:Acid phosphatase-like protein n=1 Tax=Acrodontium crateriforme TaxID=150365 RepID=A0AAQ3MCS1_9PEZI|nr:Hypothetical protein R9X50_00563000 [Acrodontium crateriforme]